MTLSRIRSFIAIPLSENDLLACRTLQKTLKKALKLPELRWTPSENLHLTLQFLGDIEPKQVPALQQMLAEKLLGKSSFEIPIRHLDRLPHRNPHVLTLNLSLTEPLALLFRDLNEGLSLLGFPPENRPFLPHITLARSRPHSTVLMNLILPSPLPLPLSIQAESILLLHSEQGPAGTSYRELFRKNL